MVRILCLHGRGGNNDIFRMQTAPFRSHLDGYEFDFVEGQSPYQEVNGMLYAKNFANDKLYAYYNGLDLPEIRRIEEELLELAFEEGPYDGIMGYSQGAQLAAQVLARFQRENPNATLAEQPFKFAIFFNGATPNLVYEAKEKVTPILNVDFDNDPEAKLFVKMMRDNPMLRTLQVNGMDGMQQFQNIIDPNSVPKLAQAMGCTIWPAELENGRRCLTDGKYVQVKSDANVDGRLITKIGTLHVRCLGDYVEFGEGTYRHTDPELASQYFHEHKHDFPRGYDEMRKIAELIKLLAERFC